MSGFPMHWAVAPLADIVSKLVDGSHNPPPKNSQGLPMLSALNIAQNTIDFSSYRLINPESFASENRRTRVSPGDVLLTIVGAIGRAAVVPQNSPPFTLQRSVAVMSPVLIEPRFLMYQIEAPELARSLKDKARGTAQKGIYLKTLGQIEIAFPPLGEQRRIVAKIEELFSEIDKGIESLTTAREQLKAYRQSILKAAFEGKLTGAWRARNVGKLENAKSLMLRIQKERKAYHDRTTIDSTRAKTGWRSGGTQNTKLLRRTRLREFPPHFNELRVSLPEPPKGWAWSHLGWSSLGPEYGTGAKSSEVGDVPVVRMGNLHNGSIIWDDLVYTSNKNEIAQYLLQPGDVLFNRTNSPELVGKTSIYEGNRPALFAGYLIRINHVPSIVDSRYLTYFLNSPIAREHGNSVKTDGVNQSNINASKLQEYPFPFCSLEEQEELVSILEDKFEKISLMEAVIDAEIARAGTLRQSILNRAFSGQLVPQDPTDEPASVLLDRIRTEKRSSPRKNRCEANARN
jgi:type I restriction enzyme S subunit